MAAGPSRLLARLEAFAAVGATAEGGVDRQALTEGDRAARALLATFARDRGFAVTQDAVANLFVTRPGADRVAPPLLVGSHLDTQPRGGRFDGALGVLSAFEILEGLQDDNVDTDRDVVVVAWTNEEGSRFAPGAMGSRAFAEGTIPADWLHASGRDGAVMGDELAATLAALNVPLRPLGFPVSAYIELHIEQGPVLERAGAQIGVVDGIQGVRWLELCFTGQSAHAGTTPLAFRRDPMQAATRALQALYASIMPNDDAARLTVGRIDCLPGSVNAIPELVRLTIDVRHPDAAMLEGLVLAIDRQGAQAASEAGCGFATEMRLDMAPQAFDRELALLVMASAAELGFNTVNLTSGAYHDALFIARVAPAAMIFVPSRGGLSHNPAEFTEPGHIEAGVATFDHVVRRLSAIP